MTSDYTERDQEYQRRASQDTIHENSNTKKKQRKMQTYEDQDESEMELF